MSRRDMLHALGIPGDVRDGLTRRLGASEVDEVRIRCIGEVGAGTPGRWWTKSPEMETVLRPAFDHFEQPAVATVDGACGPLCEAGFQRSRVLSARANRFGGQNLHDLEIP